tara:strand:+ start:2123 stop:2311 length:189 start_codon:yes stop_codon:yes gene_type:complete
MTKWEYKVLSFSQPYNNYATNLENTLNQLGAEGWETMGVGGSGSGGSHELQQMTIVLKRKID